MSSEVFTKYRIGDLVLVRPLAGEPYEAEVFGNVGGFLTVTIPGRSGTAHVSYARAELIEANPDIPLESR